MDESNSPREARGPLALAARGLKRLASAIGYAVAVPLVATAWLLALGTIAAFLWITVGVEEDLPLLGVAFVYVLRTVLGSLALALAVLPLSLVLPKRLRERAQRLSSRQFVVATVMGMVLVALFVAIEAAFAFSS